MRYLPFLILVLVPALLMGQGVPPGGYGYNQSQLLKTGWLTDSITAQRTRIKALRDSLSARPRASQVYTRQEAAGIFMQQGASIDYVNQLLNKPSRFNSRIDLVDNLQDSLRARPTRNELQALTSGLASTTQTYSKAEAQFFFAPKASSLAGYNITNAYTKLQADSATLYKSIKFGPSAVKGDGATDDTDAIQAAIDNPGTANSVFFPAGTYKVSHPIFTRGVQVLLSPGTTIAATNSYGASTYLGNDNGYVFVPGSGGSITGGVIDCKGFATGGISLIQAVDVLIRNMSIKNWTGVRFGIAIVGGHNNRIEGNNLTDGVHGINAFRSDYSFISGNYTNRCYSGIYTVASNHCEINFNQVYNCEDVGIDFEKGTHNHATNNHVEACKNGEYAIYDGGAENADQPTQFDVIFSNNTFYRSYTYLKANATGTSYVVDSVASDRGACAIWSIAPGATQVGFDGMRGMVERGYAFSHPQLTEKSGRDVFFRNSRVRSKAGFFSTLDSDGLKITGNYFEGLPGSEYVSNIFRDAHNGLMEGNTFTYVNAKANGPNGQNGALYLLTTSTFATKPPLTARNSFINTNTRAVQVSHFQNPTLGMILQENSLSTGYETNGGLIVEGNGPAVLRNQPLRILLASSSGGTTNDLNLTALNNTLSGPNKAFGNLLFGRNNYNGLLADFAWASGTGFFVRTYNTLSGLSISGSGGGVILTNTTGTATNGYLDVTVNSF